METETPAAEFLLHYIQEQMQSHRLSERNLVVFISMSPGTLEVSCVQCDIQETISDMQVLYLWFPSVLEIQTESQSCCKAPVSIEEKNRGHYLYLFFFQGG